MTKEEIEMRIEELEDKQFYLDMKDHWERKDYDLMDEYIKEKKLLQKQLEELKK